MTTIAPALTMLFAGLLVAQAVAQPQKIYRCGADGRLLQQHPCNNDAQPVKAAPSAPTDAERAEAEARAKRDAQLADRMERERVKREAADARSSAQPAGIGAPATASAPPAKSKAGKKSAKTGSGDFVAVSPAPTAAKPSK